MSEGVLRGRPRRPGPADQPGLLPPVRPRWATSPAGRCWRSSASPGSPAWSRTPCAWASRRARQIEPHLPRAPHPAPGQRRPLPGRAGRRGGRARHHRADPRGRHAARLRGQRLPRAQDPARRHPRLRRDAARRRPRRAAHGPPLHRPHPEPVPAPPGAARRPADPLAPRRPRRLPRARAGGPPRHPPPRRRAARRRRPARRGSRSKSRPSPSRPSWATPTASSGWSSTCSTTPSSTTVRTARSPSASRGPAARRSSR